MKAKSSNLIKVSFLLYAACLVLLTVVHPDSGMGGSVFFMVVVAGTASLIGISIGLILRPCFFLSWMKIGNQTTYRFLSMAVRVCGVVVLTAVCSSIWEYLAL